MKANKTIALTNFGGYDGVYTTIQTLRQYHDLSRTELLVIEQNPRSPTTASLRKQVEGPFRHGNAGTRFIEYTDAVGTAAAVQKGFDEAQTEWVVPMDAHLTPAAGALATLDGWIERNPGSLDMAAASLQLDELDRQHTHFDDVWRGGMWGTWGFAWKHPSGEHFSVLPQHNDHAICVKLAMGPQPVDFEYVPFRYAGHEPGLEAMGCERLGDSDTFEIPGQGLFMFAMRKEAWPGFNPHLRGASGSELCIHEKVRQRGGKVWNVGGFKSCHQFLRPSVKGYKQTRANAVRNYVLQLTELGIDLERCRNHFVGGELVTAEQWAAIVADPVGAAFDSPPQAQQVPQDGPGAQLKQLLESLGVEQKPNCPCRNLMARMNIAGVQGCKVDAFRQMIVGEMKLHQDKWGWSTWFTAAALAATQGLAFKLNPLDPIPGLYDEAVRREESLLSQSAKQ